MTTLPKGTHPIYQEFAEALDLVEAKAHDYAEDDNVFSNFEFAAQVAGVETEQVFAVLLGVKVARLGQLIGHGKLPNFESIDDTLLDTMNYAGLLKAYMRQNSDGMTVKQAFQVAMAEDVEFDEATYNAGESLDDGPQPLAIGMIVKRKGDGVMTRFKYIITEVNVTIGSADAVPIPDWEEELGTATRKFRLESLEQA